MLSVARVKFDHAIKKLDNKFIMFSSFGILHSSMLNQSGLIVRGDREKKEGVILHF